MNSNVTWIVFGDDWGAHPSTTQHLILNMPKEHRAIWVDSIGMRAPSINLVDLRRILTKASAQFDHRPDGRKRLYRGSIGEVTRVKPRVLPWHRRKIAVDYNTRWLKRVLEEIAGQQPSAMRILLTGNPVLAYYCDALPIDKIVYLRLDDYTLLPGCDPALVADAETKMYEKANLIVATARALLPEAPFAFKGRYLPQGVQTEAFSSVPLEPPRKPVLGFFGSLDEWLDFELIESVAQQAPDWQLEFLGKANVVPASLKQLHNVKILDRVPFDALASRISHWAAVWIPFKINKLTIGVNPLKLREYLAAGFPTLCTPLPEVNDLREHVFVASEPDLVVDWLRKTLDEDSKELRQSRRAAVAGDSWSARAATLVELINTQT